MERAGGRHYLPLAWPARPTGSAVEARLAGLGAAFRDAFARINVAREALVRIAPLPLSLSTITFTGRLSVDSLPVEDMRLAAELLAALDDDPGFEVDCDVLKRDAKRARTGDGRPAGKRFRYQLPLKRLGKSVKLFHNGSVHSTGCTSPLEFLDMAQRLTDFIEATGGPAGAHLLDFDIQLINTLFLVTCPRTGRPLTVSPGALLRHLNRGQSARADFDTERHPSVKIPVLEAGAKVATVCVFQTGSVSIMGAKHPSHLATAFETVCAALEECAPEVCAPDQRSGVRTTTAKQGLVLEEGYPLNLATCCLGP